MDIATLFENISKDISKRKLSIVFFEETNDSASVCHSVGLFELGLPEVCVFGLKSAEAKALVSFYAHLVAKGEELNEEETFNWAAPAETLMVKKLDRSQAMKAVPLAVDYYQRLKYRPIKSGVYQLIWADVRGNFPFQAKTPNIQPNFTNYH